jgi:hypothetical protein
MRLVKVSAPQGKASELLKIAFACGISELSVHAVQQHKPGSDPVVRDVIDAQVSTPEAAAFVEALVNASFFNRRDYAIEVREPRSILKSTKTRKITRPVPAPVLDIDQELWQFTHVTYSFVVRVFVAALLLSYGLVEDNPLFIIGGLVFLPFMPIVLAFSYGLMTRQWQLVAHAVSALVAGTSLVIAAGLGVAAIVDPPMMFDKFPPIAAGLCFSFAIGVAAAIGTADDVGHRQLLGLAAASQLAILPAWFGISLVFGFSGDELPQRLLAFGGNIAAILTGSVAVYGTLSIGGEVVHRVARRKEYEL